MRIHSSKYRPEPDFLRVRDFLIETYGITKQPFNWTLERWDYCFYFVTRIKDRDPQQWENDIRVWESGSGEIAGVASHEASRGEVYLQIHPDQRSLEDEMMAWAEEHLAVERKDGSHRLSVRAYDYDTERHKMLANRGYRRTEHLEHRYRRSLESPLPEPSVPDGYTVRSLGGDDELLERCLALGRAFRSDPAGINLYRTLQSAPGYRLDLDLVVEAPDGSFAAVAIAWYDEANRIGMFEPVGTVPEHQKKGLGSAIMYEGFRRLKELGAETAYVGAGTQPEASALYRSVGFDEDFTDHAWTKVF